MTIALWTQLFLAFTLLLGVCVLARRQAPAASPAGQVTRPAPSSILRIAA